MKMKPGAVDIPFEHSPNHIYRLETNNQGQNS